MTTMMMISRTNRLAKIIHSMFKSIFFRRDILSCDIDVSAFQTGLVAAKYASMLREAAFESE